MGIYTEKTDKHVQIKETNCKSKNIQNPPLFAHFTVLYIYFKIIWKKKMQLCKNIFLNCNIFPF